MDNSHHNKTQSQAIAGKMHDPLRHDSAHKHVSGSAEYIDDIPEPVGLLHGALGLSTIAHGEITSIDLSEVEATEGVIWVMTAKDIPASMMSPLVAVMMSRC
jgi:xanthine dehydrogenase large subunit